MDDLETTPGWRCGSKVYNFLGPLAEIASRRPPVFEWLSISNAAAPHNIPLRLWSPFRPCVLNSQLPARVQKERYPNSTVYSYPLVLQDHSHGLGPPRSGSGLF